MEDPNIPNLNITSLIKSAYALADALNATHLVREIFIQEKDMSFEDWSAAFKQLLIQMDHRIFEECKIPVLYLGLHKETGLPVIIQDPQPAIYQASKEIIDLSGQFGSAFKQAVMDIHQNNAIQQEPFITESHQEEASQSETAHLCELMVHIILTELGLKSADIADIY